MGICFTTVHIASDPHVPGQGSMHLKPMQAKAKLQSSLFSHSRRHPVYGSPKNPVEHEQAATPFRLMHSAFGPHGDG